MKLTRSDEFGVPKIAANLVYSFQIHASNVLYIAPVTVSCHAVTNYEQQRALD